MKIVLSADIEQHKCDSAIWYFVRHLNWIQVEKTHNMCCTGARNITKMLLICECVVLAKVTLGQYWQTDQRTASIWSSFLTYTYGMRWWRETQWAQVIDDVQWSRQPQEYFNFEAFPMLDEFRTSVGVGICKILWSHKSDETYACRLHIFK